jgi:hypothetical protein
MNSLEVQSWDDRPQANDYEIGAHGVAQESGIHHDKDSKEKCDDAPYETDRLKHALTSVRECGE